MPLPLTSSPPSQPMTLCSDDGSDLSRHLAIFAIDRSLWDTNARSACDHLLRLAFPRGNPPRP